MARVEEIIKAFFHDIAVPARKLVIVSGYNKADDN